MGLRDLEYNKKFLYAEIYLLPLILEKGTDICNIFTSSLEGIFVYDTNKPQWGNDKIILVYKDALPPKVKEIYNNSPNKYEKYLEQKDGHYHEIIAFKVPQKFKNNFFNLLNNKFPSTQFGTQVHILSFWHSYIKETIENSFSGIFPTNRRKLINKENLILNLNEVPIKKGILDQYPLYYFNNITLYIFHKLSTKIK